MGEEDQITAVSQKALFFPIVLLITAMLILAVTLIFFKYSADLKHVSPQLIAKSKDFRFRYSPDCFTYVDEVGKAHVGLIDLKLFNQKRLEKCYLDKDLDEHHSFTLTLTNLETKEETSLSTENFRGRTDFTFFYPVTIQQENKVYPGRLVVNAQRPR